MAILQIQGNKDTHEQNKFIESTSTPGQVSTTVVNPDGSDIEANYNILIRKLLQILAPIAVQDSSSRQRITVDAWSAGANTGTSTTGVNIQPTAGAAPAVGTQTYQPVIVGPVDQRYVLADQARNSYANGIRANLAFS